MEYLVSFDYFWKQLTVATGSNHLSVKKQALSYKHKLPQYHSPTSNFIADFNQMSALLFK